MGGSGNATNQAAGDEVMDVATDGYGLAYLTGETTSDNSVVAFPTTSTALQTTLASTNGNAFLTVLDTNQSGSASLVYSTYLGGDSAGPLQFGDYGLGVAVDTQGDAYLTGQTSSDASGPFPVTSGAYQSSLSSSDGDVFITEISTTQSGAQSLVYSTYFGGSTTSFLGDWGEALALDTTGKVYVTGDTETTDFPTTSGAFQTTNSAGGKSFAAKFDFTQSGTASLVYSTLLGGSNGDEGENGLGVAVDPSGDAFIAGETSSSDFPTTSGALSQPPITNNWHGFLSELNPGATGLLYSTYLGGSCATGLGDGAAGVALDSLSNAYVTGDTCSSDFPTTSQAYQTSLAGSTNAFVTKFAFNANPGITASPSPGPNAAGWNNSSVTVSFTCVPGAASIQSCTSPTTVSTEGANQVVTGTAVDTANNTASTSDTVNLDLTAPVLTIGSPANNATVATPYVVITGTLTDALSGPGSVFCNNVPAALTGTNFSCTVQLSSVSNSIVVTGSDVAGNTTSTTLTINVSMPAPTSLTVSPANPNMIVGAAQAFTAVDQTGTSRPDATWSVSDTTIASFEAGSPNTLFANAAGTVTLTAAVGSVTGQTTVTVLAGSSLSAGTVLWSAAPPSGYTAQKIVQAVPTANGPDLYAIDSDGSGDIFVQALKADGEQLWSGPTGAISYVQSGLGDNNGGLVLEGQSSDGTPELIDIAGPTGGQNWQFTTQGTGTGIYAYVGTPGDIAVGSDGTLYFTAGASDYNGDNFAEYLYAINGTTGAVVSQTELPLSNASVYNCRGFTTAWTNGTPTGPPTVASDGSVYLEFDVNQQTWTEAPEPSCAETLTAYAETLELLRVQPGGATQTQALASYSLADWNGVSAAPVHDPGDVIPDGNGGVLATYDAVPYTGDGNPIPMIADTSSGATQTLSSLYDVTSDSGLVLGDNNTTFVTDGNDVISLNASSLQQNWTYSSTSGGYDLSLVAATGGGGVTINDSQLGVIQLDSSGNPGAPTSSLQGANPFRPGLPIQLAEDGSPDLGAWAGLISGLPNFLVGSYVAVAPFIYPETSGGATGRRAAVDYIKSIAVHFSGSLSQGDGYHFNPETCTPSATTRSLGLFDCSSPAIWEQRVEIAAAVSDSASEYLAFRSVQNRATITSKDANGNLHSETSQSPGNCIPPRNIPLPGPGGFCTDGPVLWNTYPGDHVYFYTDEPGVLKPSVDSADAVDNFDAAICYGLGGECAVAIYHLHLVIDAGANLDRSQTNAGYGYWPLP